MLSTRHDPILMFTVIVSIFGVSVVMMLALNPPIIHENLSLRKPLVGSLFSLVCIFGIFAALFPKHCSSAFHYRRGQMNFDSHQVLTTSKGHHPNCKEFAAHVIHINNHILCAACTGLLLGASIALTLTTFYFLGSWRFGEMSFSVVLIGAIGLVLGFFQLKFRGFIRLMLNTFFVLGAFLILAGIDELAKSLFVDLFLTALIVFWILTRILLSQRDHWRICSNCKSPCEVGEKRKEGSVSAA